MLVSCQAWGIGINFFRMTRGQQSHEKRISFWFRCPTFSTLAELQIRKHLCNHAKTIETVTLLRGCVNFRVDRVYCTGKKLIVSFHSTVSDYFRRVVCLREVENDDCKTLIYHYFVLPVAWVVYLLIVMRSNHRWTEQFSPLKWKLNRKLSN